MPPTRKMTSLEIGKEAKRNTREERQIWAGMRLK